MNSTNPRNKTQDDDSKKGMKKDFKFRRKNCRFCEEKNTEIHYRQVEVLIHLVSNKGKILPRRLTGTCASHQREVAKAIKKSRMAGLMPFSVR